LHNARSILSDFRACGNEVFERLSRDAGKHGTIGYYRGLVSAFEARRGTLGPSGAGRLRVLVGELDFVVSTLEIETGVRGVWPPDQLSG
jgi:hypothetical protein